MTAGMRGLRGTPAGGINPDGYLQVRTLLSGRYLVGRVLEAGGDSALYIGYDQVQEAPVSIREFFPETLCGRGENGQVTLLAGCEVAYGEMLVNSAAMPVLRVCGTCRP